MNKQIKYSDIDFKNSKNLQNRIDFENKLIKEHGLLDNFYSVFGKDQLEEKTKNKAFKTLLIHLSARNLEILGSAKFHNTRGRKIWVLNKNEQSIEQIDIDTLETSSMSQSMFLIAYNLYYKKDSTKEYDDAGKKLNELIAAGKKEKILKIKEIKKYIENGYGLFRIKTNHSKTAIVELSLIKKNEFDTKNSTYLKYKKINKFKDEDFSGVTTLDIVTFQLQEEKINWAENPNSIKKFVVVPTLIENAYEICQSILNSYIDALSKSASSKEQKQNLKDAKTEADNMKKWFAEIKKQK